MAVLPLKGTEVTFSPDDIIVSKTDLKGNLTYVNETFCTVSSFMETELLGKPHSLIRHAAMPRCIFKLIWSKIQSGQEIFGYVVNKTKYDDYYWVLAHVTPSLDMNNAITGYHSNRRVPDRRVLNNIIIPLYADLLDIESRSSNAKDGMNKSFDHLLGLLEKQGLDYEEFILTL